MTRWDVELNPGSTFGPLRIVLKRGASILAHARDSSDGLGLAGVRICLVAANGLEEALTAAAHGRAPPHGPCTTSNRQGWLRLAGLPEGSFFLVSSAPKHSVGCREIALDRRAETVIDDLEIPRPATVLLSVSGGSALPTRSKLNVVATPELCGHTLWKLSRYLSVPPDGEVTVDGLPPGRLHLEATIITPGGLAATADRETMRLFAGDIRSVQLDLSGRLYHGSVSFRDEPVQASLELRGIEKAAPARGVARSDDGGSFAVLLHHPGHYDVRVLAHHPSLDTVVPRVSFSDPKTPVDIVVPDTAIRGVVVDEHGQATADARVEGTLLPDDTGGGHARSALRALTARTASTGDGSFVLEGLAPGSWTLTASAGESSSDPKRLTIAEGRAIENVILTLRKKLNIEGSVHTERGTPVAGAHVIVSVGHGRRAAAAATTDASGRFTLSVNARSGWQANFEVVGGTAVSWCARLPLAQTMDLVLPALGGTVVFSDGSGGMLASPNHVALVRADGSFLSGLALLTFGGASVSRTAKGRALTVRAMGPGRWYVVQVSSPAELAQVLDGYGLQLPTAASFTVGPGASVTVPLSMN